MSFDPELSTLWHRLEANPSDLQLHFDYGEALMERHHFDQAAAHLIKALCNPRVRRRAAALLAEAYSALDMPGEADRLRRKLKAEDFSDG
jgi:thioredoxin-like negative regulator of GroEL